MAPPCAAGTRRPGRGCLTGAPLRLHSHCPIPATPLGPAMPSSHRRTFLATSVAALSAAAYAGAADRPNEKIVLAVMGVHGRGRDLLQGFSGFDDVEIAYVCDPDSNVVPGALDELKKRQSKEPK